MEKITYKGITLHENTFDGYMAGEGKYAVFCEGRKKVPFDSVADFKRAVNGNADKFDSVLVINADGTWSPELVRVGEEFKKFAKNAK